MTNTLIRTIEEVSFRALPAFETRYLGGWVLRFAGGYSRRANSVNPLYDSDIEGVEDRIVLCERLYFRRSMNVYFKMTPAAFPAGLDAMLDRRGYVRQAPTSVQTLELAHFDQTPSMTIQTSERLTDGWLADFCRLNQVKPQYHEVVRRILLSVVPSVCYAWLYEKEAAAAVGMAVCDGDYVGCFDIVTDSAYRRQGFASEIMAHLLHWGKTQGAKTAYLQVMRDNEPALQLYGKLGFREAYPYWYRAKAF